MSMNAEQRRRQTVAICVEYKKLVANGVLQQLADDIDESRKLWATKVLCRLIPSLTTCTDFELNILRDILNGKHPKIVARLIDVLNKTKQIPAAYVNHLMHKDPRFKRFLDPNVAYGFENLPIHCAFIILKQEEARAGGGEGYRKRNWKPLQQRRAAQSIEPEQQQLWGR